jgi:hypothetical protein
MHLAHLQSAEILLSIDILVWGLSFIYLPSFFVTFVLSKSNLYQQVDRGAKTTKQSKTTLLLYKLSMTSYDQGSQSYIMLVPLFSPYGTIFSLLNTFEISHVKCIPKVC